MRAIIDDAKARAAVVGREFQVMDVRVVLIGQARIALHAGGGGLPVGKRSCAAVGVCVEGGAARGLKQVLHEGFVLAVPAHLAPQTHRVDARVGVRGVYVDLRAVPFAALDRQRRAKLLHIRPRKPHAVDADQQNARAAAVQPYGGGAGKVEHTGDLIAVSVSGNVQRPGVLRKRNFPLAEARAPARLALAARARRGAQ